VIADEVFMNRAIQLARYGDNRTKTNPRVGAVVVYKNKIIGEGWHREHGEAHAEIRALQEVKKEDIQFLPKSTIYVTLEPCSFVGKSPSCAHRLVREKLRRVVIGAIDPNPRVNGGGCRVLKEAGVEVTVGVRAQDCDRLLLPFAVQQKERRPYIHLKWAQSYDGYLGKEEEQTDISHPYLKYTTHQIRGQCQAILVGTETLLIDNPRLDNRLGLGDSPIKIILDRRGRIPLKYWQFLMSKGPSLGMGPPNHHLLPYFDQYVSLSGKADLHEIVHKLYKQGIGSLMIEGGSQLIRSCIQKKLWDFATIIKSPDVLGEGIQAPFLQGHLVQKLTVQGHKVLNITPHQYADAY